ncbi:hypothetical protein [Rhodanobacter lindaniclasticus]
MPDLAAAMKHDPGLNVLLMGGYFDLGTPFYSAEYEMHQLPIPDRLQKNISYQFFPSGHMVYTWTPTRTKACMPRRRPSSTATTGSSRR